MRHARADAGSTSRRCGRTCCDDPNVGGIVLNTRDVTERKAFEEQLAHQAFHDSLTGLANRRCSATASSTRSSAARATTLPCRGAVHRPRRLQDGQRHRSATRPATRSCARSATALTRLPARGRHRRPPRRRRVRGPARGRRRRRSARPRSRADPARAREPVRTSRAKEVFVRASIGIAIGDADMRGGRGRRGAPAQRRRRDVHGQGERQGPLPGLRARRCTRPRCERLELKADLQRAVEHGEFIAALPADRRAARPARSTGLEALVRWQHPRARHGRRRSTSSRWPRRPA